METSLGSPPDHWFLPVLTVRGGGGRPKTRTLETRINLLPFRKRCKKGRILPGVLTLAANLHEYPGLGGMILSGLENFMRNWKLSILVLGCLIFAIPVSVNAVVTI